MAFRRFVRKTGVPALILLVLLVLAFSTFAPGKTAYAASAVTIDGSTHYQTMDGFGFSDTQGGSAVTITNLSYNASIPAGATLSSPPGFNGAWSGSNGPPSAFTLNGSACTVI